MPRRPGGRRLSRRRIGLAIAFGLAIAANVVVILANRHALPFYGAQGSAGGARFALASPVPPSLLEQDEPKQEIQVKVAEPALAAPDVSVASAEVVAAPAPVAPAPDETATVAADTTAQDQTAPAAVLTAVALDTAAPLAPEALALRALHDAFPVEVLRGAARDLEGRVKKTKLAPDQTLAGALLAQGLGEKDVNGVIAALSGKLDFRKVRPGDGLAVFFDPIGALERVELKTAAGQGPGSIFVASRDGAEIKGEEQPIEITTRRSLVSGDVHSTLYESMLATGEGTELIRRFTEVFGWEIDFYREVREGDRFRALVEKRYVDDRFIGYGRLLAAEYRAHDGAHRAFHFEDERTAGYFNDSGESMQKSFLKSPVEVTRITSHFGMRFHPVHKRHRKHNGVDYGAPQGTSIWTVADGVVTARTYSRGIGNHVKVRHANGYETIYGHMSRFADITVGSKVRQRQVVGYCGSTGVSTGPHVHYGMLKKGTYINPLTQKFPRGNAVPEASRAAFAEQLRSLTSELDAVEIALAAERLAGQG